MLKPSILSPVFQFAGTAFRLRRVVAEIGIWLVEGIKAAGIPQFQPGNASQISKPDLAGVN
jgi:hypothetical protein